MEVIGNLSRVSLRQETILTIGAFDGVHLGHRALIEQVVARARTTDRLAALITFHPHPAVVLAPDRAPLYLTTPGEKLALLEPLGVDLVVMLAFDRQLAATPARDFMQSVSEHLRVRELWLGHDFALGRDRGGDVQRLQDLSREFGYDVQIVEPVTLPGGSEVLISSSRIRALLREGQVAEAAQMLGRFPSLSGEVVQGQGRGRKLGFPTANLEVRPERAVPANGVYAVLAVLGETRYPAVANVGVRPSFDAGPRTVETHIFDFDEDLYGCDLVVEFVDRLRDERRFSDITDLVTQIERDSQRARGVLAGLGQDGRDMEKGPVVAGERAACPYRFEEIEHTADRALRVWGERLQDLFVGAARGMYSLMSDYDDLVASQWRQIRLQGWDRETLLVQWLNELLFFTEMERLVFTEYRISSLTETSLSARAGGAPVHATKTQIKAATFHDLELAQTHDGWSAVITFDV